MTLSYWFYYIQLPKDKMFWKRTGWRHCRNLSTWFADVRYVVVHIARLSIEISLICVSPATIHRCIEAVSYTRGKCCAVLKIF